MYFKIVNGVNVIGKTHWSHVSQNEDPVPWSSL